MEVYCVIFLLVVVRFKSANETCGVEEQINPLVDIAFKKIFGVPENKDLLVDLINSIVSEKDHVVDIIILNPYNKKNVEYNKLSTLDIKARSKDNRRFNIQIQVTDVDNYDKRVLHDWTKLYSGPLRKDENYTTLQKSIGIHFVNIALPEPVDSYTDSYRANRYHKIFVVTEKSNGLEYFPDFEIHFIELRKFNYGDDKGISDVLKRINNPLDIWCAFLTRYYLFDKDNLHKRVNNDILKKALEVLSVMKLTPEEHDIYETHSTWLQTETSVAEKARRVAANAEKKSLAKKLLLDNVDVNKVSIYTGLSVKEIELLKNNK